MVSTTLSLHFQKYDQLKSKVVYIQFQVFCHCILAKLETLVAQKRKICMDYTCVLSPFQYSTRSRILKQQFFLKKIKSLVSISWHLSISASSSYISYLSQARVRFVQFNTKQQSVSQHFYQSLPTLSKLQTQVLNRILWLKSQGFMPEHFTNEIPELE